ncbi:N-acetylneuraminate synthase [Thermoanaerobacterium sp. DL9XJH110]|uniref:N-acetylneuraminate synthase n=1 Tax=Thermoanaerobacterium sp. DL9XJH110 TaxID=3386643 RepID=UPI003BB727C5
MFNNVFIIAEAGVNHNGNIETAKRMVDEAIKSGANAIKFQTFVSEKVVTVNAPKAEYQKINMPSTSESQYKMIKNLELTYDDFVKIKRYCDEKKIMFLSSPFDLQSIDFLVRIDVPYIKIPSGEITNLPYLKKVGRTKKPVILSTGMSTLGEVENAVNILKNSGTEEIILLHCTTNYPTPVEEVNLLAMITMKHAFNLMVGYSDHTRGINIPIAAVALGAKVIEKHFTLDKNMAGPDHKASLEPEEFKEMVKAIREVEKSLGNGIKIPTESEQKIIPIVRRSIVAARDIKQGEILTEENIVVKRPGTGISPMFIDTVLGRKAKCLIKKDDVITWDMI